MTTPSDTSALLDVPAADPALGTDARALHRVMADLLRLVQLRDRDRICCHDVSVTQCFALEVLAERGGLTLSGLAEALRLDKSTVSRVVDALERKGYVLRRPRPDDRRALLLEPTPAGLALYRQIDAELIQEVEHVVRDFDPEVRRAMTRLLTRLVQASASRLGSMGCGGAC